MSSTRIYLSFADPARPRGEQWLGAVVVFASHMVEAIQKAHFMEINPGGSVAGMPIDDHLVVPERFLNRLLTRAEVDELSDVFLSQQTKH